MANTILTADVIAGEALDVLRNNAVMPNLVYRDYSGDFVPGVGETISVRKPATFVANEYAGTLTVQDATEAKDTVTMDKHLDVSFAVTSKEMTMSIEDFSAQFLTPAMQAFLDKVDGYLIAAGVAAAKKTVATSAAVTQANIVAARQAIVQGKAPTTDRNFVFGPQIEADLLNTELFVNAGASGDQKKLLQGLLPLGVSNKTLTGNSLTDRHGDAWWAGFTTELKVLDPFRFALDATYGRVDLGEGLSTKGKKIDVKREGWIVSALAEYKMESVTPGLTAWYSSGDDANVNNGSERLPTINPDVKVTSYGFDGTNFCRAQQVLGTSVDGTFGIVGHLKDISFFEDLSHTLRVAFYRGTNNTENVRQKMITKPSETVSSMYYMTTADKAWEVNVDSEYKIYKNLSLFLELGYIRMDLDSNVWKDYESKKNNFKGAVCVLYSF